MRFSRLYEQTAEFRRRCKAFDFAAVAQAVVEIALEARKALKGWWNAVRPKVETVKVRKPHQLVLELNGIAQIPLFGLYNAPMTPHFWQASAGSVKDASMVPSVASS